MCAQAKSDGKSKCEYHENGSTIKFNCKLRFGIREYFFILRTEIFTDQNLFDKIMTKGSCKLEYEKSQVQNGRIANSVKFEIDKLNIHELSS